MMKILLFISLCGVALSLRCYDCDPRETNGCRNPEENNVKITDCETTSVQKGKGLIQFDASTTNQTECFTIYFTPNDKESGSPEGIYRGCAQRQTHGCNYAVGGLIECHQQCYEDGCNKANGSSSVAVSIITLFVGYILCFYM